jgi:hypothetical protein
MNVVMKIWPQQDVTSFIMVRLELDILKHLTMTLHLIWQINIRLFVSGLKLFY